MSINPDDAGLEPVSVMYIASSGNGNFVLKGAAPTGLSMRPPEVVVANSSMKPEEYHYDNNL